MIFISRNLFVFALICIPLKSVAATSFVVPGGAPVLTVSSPPAWLAGGSGDDGYVTVRADVKMPNIGCAALGKKGLIGNIFQEKMQIVASVKTTGFRTNLDGQTLPVATFDGRAEPGACTGFNTLPATIIPYARLEPFSPGAPGALAIIFDIKSTTDEYANLVSGAQMVLGAAAVFTTGGAATTVAGLTSALAKPALTNLEQKIDKNSGVLVGGQERVDLTWQNVRDGITSIVVPVYAGKTEWGETASEAIGRVRKTKMKEEDKLFDVVLTFSYTKTLFDPRISSAADLPKNDALASLSVLNYPRLPGIQNFLQLLNSSSPSLLQTFASATTPGAKAAASSQALEVLKSAGLNLIDRAIVMKSFIDEAHKGANWYTVSEVNAYFYNFPELRDQVFRIYGNVPNYFTIRDTQVGAGPAFAGWKVKVPPVLADLRQALTTTEARTGVLTNFNGGADIELSFYPNSNGWIPAVAPAQGVTAAAATPGTALLPVDVSVAYPPGITKLAAGSVRKAGCFVYGEPSNLDPNTMGGHMIVISEQGDIWHLDAQLARKGTGKIGKVTLARMSDDWKNFFKSTTYDGGDCPGILTSL